MNFILNKFSTLVNRYDIYKLLTINVAKYGKKIKKKLNQWMQNKKHRTMSHRNILTPSNNVSKLV